MPRYGPVWLEIAREQYTSLPAETRGQVDARIERRARTRSGSQSIVHGDGNPRHAVKHAHELTSGRG